MTVCPKPKQIDRHDKDVVNENDDFPQYAKRWILVVWLTVTTERLTDCVPPGSFSGLHEQPAKWKCSIACVSLVECTFMSFHSQRLFMDLDTLKPLPKGLNLYIISRWQSEEGVFGVYGHPYNGVTEGTVACLDLGT